MKKIVLMLAMLGLMLIFTPALAVSRPPRPGCFSPGRGGCCRSERPALVYMTCGTAS